MMEKILIPFIDTPDEKFVQPIDKIAVYLYDNYLSFDFSGYVKESDSSKETYFLEAGKIDKENISFIKLLYHQTNEQFLVTIFTIGVPDSCDFDIYFEDFAPAKEYYDKITKWRFEK